MTIDELKQNAIFDDNPAGFIIVDGQQVAQTKQCCHCGRHFVSVKGSGKIRGRCMDCKSVTCGFPACDIHIPLNVKLDFIDGGDISPSVLQQELRPYKDKLKYLVDKFGSVL